MSSPRLIKPRPVGGFPEWLPHQKLLENSLLDLIREQFELFGFAPMETPAIERKDVLAAKGVAEKEIYALSRLAAAEGEDATTEMALHFDLTVPLARYVAQHYANLTFPFRRYQIQKVWRGERPQAGRFREFYQCDIDVVGNGALGLLNDAEIPSVIHAVFSKMGIGDFRIRVSNRKLLQGLMLDLEIAPEAGVVAMRIIDALEKIGRERVERELREQARLSEVQAQSLLDFTSSDADLDALKARSGGELYAQGVQELGEVMAAVRAFGVPEETCGVDLSIARGLDYYTGTVYETTLINNPEFGSVCSGGRYDDLASNYTKKKLPGVGISIGLTRLLSRLLDAGLLKAERTTPARILVTTLERERLDDYLSLAADLRSAAIPTELFTETKKLGAQLKYADQRGFEFALIAGGAELERGVVTLKALQSGEQHEVPRAELGARAVQLLRGLDTDGAAPVG